MNPDIFQTSYNLAALISAIIIVVTAFIVTRSK